MRPSEYQENFWTRVRRNLRLREAKRLWGYHLGGLRHLGVINSGEETTYVKKKWTLIVDPLEKRFTESKNLRLKWIVFETLWDFRQRGREISRLASKGAIIEDQFVYRVKTNVLLELDGFCTVDESDDEDRNSEEGLRPWSGVKPYCFNDDDEDYVRRPERRPRNDYWGWEEDYWAEDNWAQYEHDRDDAFGGLSF